MISAHQRTVSKVLGDEYLHEIPAFQRPYAWRPQEAEQLLDDLIDAANGNKSDNDYFLGSLVLIKKKMNVSSIVIDGQQRITTLTILCAVLRDIATSDKERSALQMAVYVEPNPFAGVTESLRLQPQTRDAAFFLESIQRDGRTSQESPAWQPQNEAQKLMWANSQILRSRLLQINDSARQKLVVYLLNRCILVTVETETRSAALRIFRVLNDRGLDLSNADVIKADLISKLSPEETTIAHFANLWRDIEVDLGRSEFEGLLEYLRFLHERGKSRGTLAEAYELRFKNATAAAVQGFIIEELSPSKDSLMEILRGDASSFPPNMRPRVVEALAGLRLLPNNDWTAVALAILRCHTRSEKTIQLLELLEGLAWVQQLLRRYDTQRLARYSRCIEALTTEVEPEQLFKLTQEETTKAAAALQGNVYTEYPVRVVRAMLQRLDRLISDQPLFTETMSVEHILPQNPSHEDWQVFSESQRIADTHRIGNLVLLSRRKNSSASNLPFTQKKKSYFGVGDGKWPTYASVNELSGLDAWNPTEFTARQNRHSTILGERWGFSHALANAQSSSEADADAINKESAYRTDVSSNFEHRTRAYEALLGEAKAGNLPEPPDFSAPTHERYRGKLNDLVNLANSGDLGGLQNYQIMGPNATVVSTSPRMMLQYRDLCVVALKSRSS